MRQRESWLRDTAQDGEQRTAGGGGRGEGESQHISVQNQFPPALCAVSGEKSSSGPRYADLHLHTSASDGCLSPAEVVELAAREGLAAISICDHDTVAGLPEAIAAAEKIGIELIRGMELSCYLSTPAASGRASKPGSEVHILGYCFDHENAALTAVLRRLCAERLERIEKMIHLLGKLGVRLERSDIDRAAAFGSVGRMHVARVLVEQGFVSDTREAFAQYIGGGKPAYVPRVHVTPAEACGVITRAKGIPVLAHPSLLDSDKLIPTLVKEGIMGIEAFYGTVGPQAAEHYCRLAEKWGLLVTGGSDSHQGENGPFLIGTVKLDYMHVEKLKKKASELLVGEGQK